MARLHGGVMTSIDIVGEVLSGRPELLDRLQRLFGLVEDGRVDPSMLDLCRKGVGTLLGCPDHAAALPAGDDLGETDRACLDFCELFVMDHAAITDADAARVSERLGDAGMVAFTTALALYDGFCRFEILVAGG